MSEQEKTQEDTITESSQLSSLIESQITRERIRYKQRLYRQKRRQKEIELQQNYQQLQARFHAMEINYHVATKQSILHAVKAQEYKSLCQTLINHLINQRTVPEKPSPEIECIEIDDHEEITEEIVNVIPSYTLENNNEIKIDETTIQYGNNITSAFNWTPIDPEELK